MPLPEKVRRVFILTLFTVFITYAYGTEAINGTTVVLDFDHTANDAFITYNEKRIPLVAHPVDEERLIALVPIGYRCESGRQEIELEWGNNAQSYFIHVKQGNYPSEALQVSASKVSPSQKAANRIAKEYEEAMAIYNRHNPQRFWKSPFIYPLESNITSPYGTARTYNGMLKGFHSGTDFKACEGTPIVSVNDGIVALAKRRYYAGNSVVIDHGEGLYSCYYHLSRIDVKVGQKVRQGQQLGLSGNTGRVTGPHLHFSFMVHGVPVDPMQLIERLNTLFKEKHHSDHYAASTGRVIR